MTSRTPIGTDDRPQVTAGGGTPSLPSLDGLTPPAGMATDLHGVTRAEWIGAHAIRVRLDWWQRALQERGLPGGPVAGQRNGAVVHDGEATITREQLFAFADPDGDLSDEEALRLLWHALAWGAGTSARNMQRRLDAIVARPDAGPVLARAAALSRVDPEGAFALLRSGSTRLPWLGPAFFTKFLYFAGAGHRDHPCLILDARVAAALRYRCGWESLHPGGPWPAVTYGRYCRLLRRWASRLGHHPREIAADEIERWLFQHGPLAD